MGWWESVLKLDCSNGCKILYAKNHWFVHCKWVKFYLNKAVYKKKKEQKGQYLIHYNKKQLLSYTYTDTMILQTALQSEEQWIRIIFYGYKCETMTSFLNNSHLTPSAFLAVWTQENISLIHGKAKMSLSTKILLPPLDSLFSILCL